MQVAETPLEGGDTPKRITMNKSESIVHLSAALSKAQAEMPIVKMNSVNPFLKNKFADLGAVIEASRKVLGKYGLSISQFPTSFDNKIGVTTALMHESGEWLEETALLPLDDEKGKSAAQVAGSIITYLRRYSWSAVLGLYADEDTDGNQPQPKAKPESLRDRYGKLLAHAKEIGLEGVDAYELTEKMTDPEITQLGVELKAKVDAKEGK